MADLIVVSPGVPMDIKPLQLARAQKRRVISEIELAACRHLRADCRHYRHQRQDHHDHPDRRDLRGVRLQHLCRREYRQSAHRPGSLGGTGGAGRGRAQLFPARGDQKASVPRVAVLLNITEDHLDRYASFQEYIDAKVRIFENQTSEDFAVLNVDDPLVADYAGKIAARVVPMSQQRELDQGIFYRDGSDHLPLGGTRGALSNGRLPSAWGPQPGEHHGCPGNRPAHGVRCGRQPECRRRFSRPAPPHGAGPDRRRDSVVRRQQGDQRGERGKGPGQLRQHYPHCRRQGQGGLLCSRWRNWSAPGCGTWY